MKREILILSLIFSVLNISAQNKKNIKEKEDAIYTITAIDSSVFTFYYWYTAEKKTSAKTEKINIMSEKISPQSMPEALSYIKEQQSFQNLELEPLIKIKLDHDVVKTDEMIYMVDGKAISGAGKIFYFSKCFEGSFIRKDCLWKKK